MRQITKIFAITFFLWTIFCGPWTNSYAAVPHLINYQGRLTDSGGTPLNGSYSLTFRIYDDKSGGSLLWEEKYTGEQGMGNKIPIEKGVFSVLLGSITALNLPFDKPYFLEIKVGNEVMNPRQRITSAGYAIRAEEAESAIQAQNADTVGNVGVSTTPASNKILPLDSNAKLPASAMNLKTYDSGWFEIADNKNHVKTHNLGTTKVLITLMLSDSASGTNMSLGGSDIDAVDGGYGSLIYGLSTTTISLRTTYTQFAIWNGNDYFYATHARIIMLALE